MGNGYAALYADTGDGGGACGGNRGGGGYVGGSGRDGGEVVVVVDRGDDGGERSACVVKEVKVVVVVVRESAQEVQRKGPRALYLSNVRQVGVASIGAQHFSAEQCYNVLRDM
ncbi:unnamed protein product [Prunus armeniaca]